MSKGAGVPAVLTASGELDDGSVMVVISRIVAQAFVMFQANPTNEQIPQMVCFEVTILGRV